METEMHSGPVIVVRSYFRKSVTRKWAEASLYKLAHRGHKVSRHNICSKIPRAPKTIKHRRNSSPISHAKKVNMQ